jgi:Protein phosphatase 2C
MWRSIGAKAKGAAHAVDGTPCQDAFAYASLDDNLVAIAVADGAGSAPFSRSGAEISVDRVIRYLRNVGDLLAADKRLWVPAVRGAFEAARGSVIDFGHAKSIDARQFATTLQVVLLDRAAYCYGRIGDGGGVGRIRGALVPLAPAPGNVFANETTFLTSTGSEPEVFFNPDPLSDCAVFTDGLQHLAMQLAHWKPHDPFFVPIFEFLRTNPDVAAAQDNLGAYLRTERFDQRTDDDRTLVVAVWTGDATT